MLLVLLLILPGSSALPVVHQFIISNILAVWSLTCFGFVRSQAATMVIKESVEPLLEEYRPPGITSLKFSKLSLGNVAPKIEGMDQLVVLIYSPNKYLLATYSRVNHPSCLYFIFLFFYFYLLLVLRVESISLMVALDHLNYFKIDLILKVGISMCFSMLLMLPRYTVP